MMLIGLKAVVHNNAHWAQSGSIRGSVLPRFSKGQGAI